MQQTRGKRLLAVLVLCALGLLVADVVLDYSRAVLQPVVAETPARLRAQLDEMIAQARVDLQQEGIAEEAMVFDGLLDARYRGQSFELTIPFVGDVLAGFHRAHGRSYGHAMPERTVEVVNLRLQATGLVAKPVFVAEPTVENDGADAFLGHKAAFVGDGWQQIALYDRARLRPGAAFSGPALVFQLDSTVFVAPGWSARVDAYRNIVLERVR